MIHSLLHVCKISPTLELSDLRDFLVRKNSTDNEKVCKNFFFFLEKNIMMNKVT